MSQGLWNPPELGFVFGNGASGVVQPTIDLHDVIDFLLGHGVEAVMPGSTLLTPSHQFVDEIARAVHLYEPLLKPMSESMDSEPFFAGINGLQQLEAAG